LVETLSVQRSYLKMCCVQYDFLSFYYYCIHLATKIISLSNKILFRFVKKSTKNNKYPNVSTNSESVLVETMAVVVETSKLCQNEGFIKRVFI